MCEYCHLVYPLLLWGPIPILNIESFIKQTNALLLKDKIQYGCKSKFDNNKRKYKKMVKCIILFFATLQELFPTYFSSKRFFFKLFRTKFYRKKLT